MYTEFSSVEQNKLVCSRQLSVTSHCLKIAAMYKAVASFFRQPMRQSNSTQDNMQLLYLRMWTRMRWFLSQTFLVDRRRHGEWCITALFHAKWGHPYESTQCLATARLCSVQKQIFTIRCASCKLTQLFSHNKNNKQTHCHPVFVIVIADCQQHGHQ